MTQDDRGTDAPGWTEAPGVGLADVRVRHGRRGTALDVAALEWAPGTVHGLLGPNGSGKSTLMAVVAGFRRPSSGRVRVAGVDPFEHAPTAARTCLVREGGDVVASDRVRDVLRTAAALRPTFSPGAAARLAETFAVPTRSFVDRLSRGQRSALGIVLGLAARAPLTLLDEVTLGLDAGARATFAAELAREQAEHPRTVVVATHLVDEVEPLLEHVTVLRAGSVLLHADVEAARSWVLTVSGAVPAVEGFAVGRDVIADRRLGGTAEVVVADPDDRGRAATSAPGALGRNGRPSVRQRRLLLDADPELRRAGGALQPGGGPPVVRRGRAGRGAGRRCLVPLARPRGAGGGGGRAGGVGRLPPGRGRGGHEHVLGRRGGRRRAAPGRGRAVPGARRGGVAGAAPDAPAPAGPLTGVGRPLTPSGRPAPRRSAAWCAAPAP